MTPTKVRPHARRGTRGVRGHLRWRTPTEHRPEVVMVPTEHLYAGGGGFWPVGPTVERWVEDSLRHDDDRLRIDYLRGKLRRGEELDPVVIGPDSVTPSPPLKAGVWDGYHRVAAARAEGVQLVPTVSREKHHRVTGRPVRPEFYTPGSLY